MRTKLGLYDRIEMNNKVYSIVKIIITKDEIRYYADHINFFYSIPKVEHFEFTEAEFIDKMWRILR